MVLTVDKPKSLEFDEALEEAGFGKYNIGILSVCCLLILAMYLDIFGFSIILPVAACDLQLSTEQQAMLSAVPLIGVMCMSYVWGLTADTLGRRTILLYGMGAGFLVNLAASMASGYVTLCVLKFISASFTASANAAGFVLVGEVTPVRHRNRFMFLMASATMFTQFIIAVLAVPILPLTFRYSIEFLGMEYRPWRLLMQVLSLPGGIGTLMLYFYFESPKFLLNQRKEEEALKTLRTIYRSNTGCPEENYPVQSIYLVEMSKMNSEEKSIFCKIWNQTAPLFKPPLLKYSLMIYYILLAAYMTSTGYTMWVPTLTNMYFDGGNYEGSSFCDVASGAASATEDSGNTTVVTDCNNVVQPMTLYAVMFYSGGSGSLTIVLSFIVGFCGRKKTIIGVFTVCATCGALLNFVKIPVLSILLFYLFLYVCLVLAGINSYIVELYPTHLRGMATCLSVVVARGSGFLSVNLIAKMLPDYCEPTIYSFVALVISGGLVSFLLPSDKKKQMEENGPLEIS